MKTNNNKNDVKSLDKSPKQSNNTIRKKHKSMNFEEYASEGNRIIHEVALELGTDRNRAARILRVVLHAIRDRIPPDDAIEFAQGLPMALKGVFIDGYDISKTPIRIRSREKFIDFIYSKGEPTSAVDFPDRNAVAHALQGVFTVLQPNMDFGQVQQIKNLMNTDLVDLIEGYY